MTNIFLTGQIQIGKSTVLKKVIEMLRFNFAVNIGGICTFHVPENRHIFIRRFNDQPLSDYAHRAATWQHNHMMSHTEIFNQFGNLLTTDITNSDIIVLDELGFLEKEADAFTSAVFSCLASPIPCIGILRKAYIPWQRPIYDNPDNLIIEVTMANRQGLPYEIYQKLSEQLITNGQTPLNHK